MLELQQSPLGRATRYIQTYTPELLFSVSRAFAREPLGISGLLPFQGFDRWSGFELSWLNLKGKPEIAMAEFYFPCTTPYLVESKSFKLYLNSLNQTPFDSFEAVKKTLEDDLSHASGGDMKVNLIPSSAFHQWSLRDFSGIDLDALDIYTNTYDIHSDFLTTQDDEVEETLYSHLLKSNCMSTGQPDWGSLLIRYKGSKIDHEGLLKYIISFRNHVGFGEHCAERIFYDILEKCRPQFLFIYAHYTRRGGLEIDVSRFNFEYSPPHYRQLR